MYYEKKSLPGGIVIVVIMKDASQICLQLGSCIILLDVKLKRFYIFHKVYNTQIRITTTEIWWKRFGIHLSALISLHVKWSCWTKATLYFRQIRSIDIKPSIKLMFNSMLIEREKKKKMNSIIFTTSLRWFYTLTSTYVESPNPQLSAACTTISNTDLSWLAASNLILECSCPV